MRQYLSVWQTVYVVIEWLPLTNNFNFTLRLRGKKICINHHVDEILEHVFMEIMWETTNQICRNVISVCALINIQIPNHSTERVVYADMPLSGKYYIDDAVTFSIISWLWLFPFSILLMAFTCYNQFLFSIVVILDGGSVLYLKIVHVWLVFHMKSCVKENRKEISSMLAHRKIKAGIV